MSHRPPTPDPPQNRPLYRCFNRWPRFTLGLNQCLVADRIPACHTIQRLRSEGTVERWHTFRHYAESLICKQAHLAETEEVLQ